MPPLLRFVAIWIYRLAAWLNRLGVIQQAEWPDWSDVFAQDTCYDDFLSLDAWLDTPEGRQALAEYARDAHEEYLRRHPDEGQTSAAGSGHLVHPAASATFAIY
jgi:hypothetical protein